MIGPYLIDSITQKQFKGADIHGEPNARTSITRRARIEYKQVQVVDQRGETVLSRSHILLRPLTIVRTGFAARAAATIAYEDLIRFDGVDHAIIAIEKKKDFTTRFLVVYVK